MTKDLINRITYHLSSGGLFNPELADHLAVRNLLMECREALAQPEQEPVACDGDFPEGFDASLGVPAQALRVANAIMCDVIGKREWDVPCTAQHVLSFAKKYTTPPQRKPLTDEEIRRANHHMVEGAYQYSFKQGVKWAEYKHNIKGEA